MNKTELVNAIAGKAGLTKVASRKALDAALQALAADLKAGNSTTLIGFGTFSVTKRKARTGINPRTKKAIKIPAKKVAKFKASKKLL
ncbi:MAG: HU family DNA-binding protein [Bacteroidales bacterium]|nr:HU family DNA-binding protein [Bacteroidales bacterium]